MDKEACGASGFEHGTVAGVLWQKGALGLAARPNTDSGSERVGKESYFHLGIIASSKHVMFRGLRSGLQSYFAAVGVGGVCCRLMHSVSFRNADRLRSGITDRVQQKPARSNRLRR
jgi:hypothetical protein